ncbi:MAG: FeoB-associated Cys-rich membrane protein [Armatimonadota bacterium]
MTQTIIVAIIVLAAVVWAIWSIIRRTGSGGCASCESAGSCPYASKGAGRSEVPEDPQVCDSIRQKAPAITDDTDDDATP